MCPALGETGDLDDDESQDKPRPKRVLAIGEVRTTGVRELWAYCGHGDPERRRRRGQTQDDALASGNPLAKMIVHQMTEFALRNNGVPDKNGKERGQTPYYDAYLAARMTAENNHPEWKPGHVYNYAVRKVGKGILKDLWRVQHGEGAGLRRAYRVESGAPGTAAGQSLIASACSQVMLASQ